MQQRQRWFFAGLLLLFLCGGAAFAYRQTLRTFWVEWQRPELPPAQVYIPVSTSTAFVATTPSSTRAASSTAPAERLPRATSTRLVVPAATSTLATSTQIADPLAWEGDFPASINLAVPFLSQAPKQDWSMPYQEACEEAGMIMVDAFYRGRSTKFTPEEGDKAILDLVAFEESLGKSPDITAAEVAEVMRKKFGYERILILPLRKVEDIKRALAHGYPVMVPAYGKTLANPHYRNGGPPYHMLVIKGYVDHQWITNDSGTRFGADYLFPFENVLQSAHDWNKGDVPHGNPVMIVVLPR